MKRENDDGNEDARLPWAPEREPSVDVLLRAHEGPWGRFPGVLVGLLILVDDGGPYVDFPGNTAGRAVQARSAVARADLLAGREVVLVFEECDPQRPIILGLLHGFVPTSSPMLERSESRNLDVSTDGDKVVISAKHELELRCGDASITLTSGGRAVTRGAVVISHASGVNRIRGGSVQIN